MNLCTIRNCTAFEQSACLGAGSLKEVVRQVKQAMDEQRASSPLIFDDDTGRFIEVDFRGTLDAVLSRLSETLEQSIEMAQAKIRERGRPKLGVTAREVTLLPRHWEWLNSQPGGASACLRRLVEQAKKAEEHHPEKKRQTLCEVIDRVMLALSGDFPGYESASRALYAGDWAAFSQAVGNWPQDICHYCLRLAKPAFLPKAKFTG